MDKIPNFTEGKQRIGVALLWSTKNVSGINRLEQIGLEAE